MGMPEFLFSSSAVLLQLLSAPDFGVEVSELRRLSPGKRQQAYISPFDCVK
jgi:hypothetical protein